MSVIAKLDARVAAEHDEYIKLNLMTVYDGNLDKPETEDVRFTKATPYGGGEMTIKSEYGHILKTYGEGQKWEYRMATLYFIFHPIDEQPSFEDCVFAFRANCACVMDYGYSKQVEIAGDVKANDFRKCPDVPADKQLNVGGSYQVNVKLGIDNPAAVEQFEPLNLYWVTVYDANEVTLDEALALTRA